MTRIFTVAAIAVLLSVTLGGCAGYLQKHQSTEAKVVAEPFLTPRALAVVPTYCYRTIGTPVCYGWPKEHQKTRLVGYAGPAPY
ncbi:MAG: hypothetical protein VX741_11585 [Pseudomonadota bacterium]|nr:hypothetical protein [Pseudomonadota bacterium]